VAAKITIKADLYAATQGGAVSEIVWQARRAICIISSAAC